MHVFLNRVLSPSKDYLISILTFMCTSWSWFFNI